MGQSPSNLTVGIKGKVRLPILAIVVSEICEGYVIVMV